MSTFIYLHFLGFHCFSQRNCSVFCSVFAQYFYWGILRGSSCWIYSSNAPSFFTYSGPCQNKSSQSIRKYNCAWSRTLLIFNKSLSTSTFHFSPNPSYFFQNNELVLKKGVLTVRPYLPFQAQADEREKRVVTGRENPQGDQN